MCSRTDAILVTRRRDAARLIWSTDGMLLHYALGTDDYVFDVRTQRSVRVASACGFDLFSFNCPPWKSADGRLTVYVSPDARRAGGMAARPMWIQMTAQGRKARFTGALQDMLAIGAIASEDRVVFYRAPFRGADIWVDGVPLLVMDFARGARQLGITGQAGRSWMTVSPSGDEVAVTTGGIREAFRQKSIARCDLRRASCTPWNHRAGFVELDPVWSHGGTIAFIRAPEAGRDETQASWWPKRVLLAAPADGSRPPHRIASAMSGIEAPSWVEDGALLFVSRDVLFVMDPSGSTHSVARLAPLPLDASPYYGDVRTSDRYAWHT